MKKETEFTGGVTLYADLMQPFTPFDSVVVYPVAAQDEKTDNKHYEQCTEEEAEMWSVFIHLPEQGLECIADCESKELAEQLKSILEITGRMFIVE